MYRHNVEVWKGKVPKMRKELKDIVNLARAQGWTVEQSKRNSHFKLRPPPGWQTPDGSPARMVPFASTPSDWRGDKNNIALLRRLGLDI